jgi:hypothetical protein
MLTYALTYGKQMPYSKASSFDIKQRGFANLVAHLRPRSGEAGGSEGVGAESVRGEAVRASGGGGEERAPARFMVHKTGSTHFTLNLLAHVSGRPGLISYSRGY